MGKIIISVCILSWCLIFIESPPFRPRSISTNIIVNVNIYIRWLLQIRNGSFDCYSENSDKYLQKNGRTEQSNIALGEFLLLTIIKLWTSRTNGGNIDRILCRLIQLEIKPPCPSAKKPFPSPFPLFPVAISTHAKQMAVISLDLSRYSIESESTWKSLNEEMKTPAFRRLTIRFHHHTLQIAYLHFGNVEKTNNTCN